MAGREVITANDAPDALGPYSQAVSYNGMLFCTGQLGLDPDTGALVKGDVTTQARQALRNLEAICSAAGTELAKALHVRLYVTDWSALPSVNNTYREFFDDDPPARTSLQVESLADGGLVEIDAVVAIGD